MICVSNGAKRYLFLISYLREGTSLHHVPDRLGVKRVTEPNRTNGLYRTKHTEISDYCGAGFYLRHRTETTNAIIIAYFIIVYFSI